MTNKDKPFAQILIVGCGDIGLRVAKLWQKSPYSPITITAIARSNTTLEKAKQAELRSQKADLDDANGLENIATKDALIYYFAPPPAKGTQDSRMKHFLATINPQALPGKVIYISTSGVYGDQQGRLVNEETPLNPQVDRAKRRFDAEQQLSAWGQAHAVPVIILRVGGIYGPGRLPIQRIKDRVPMVYENLAPQTNRIHADDLAQVCFAAALKTTGSQIYNVTDGTNSNMTEYFNTIADAFGLQRPPLVSWDEAQRVISPGMLSYLKESRKLDNSKMLKELGIKLLYPSLQNGLKSCIE